MWDGATAAATNPGGKDEERLRNLEAEKKYFLFSLPNKQR